MKVASVITALALATVLQLGAFQQNSFGQPPLEQRAKVEMAPFRAELRIAGEPIGFQLSSLEYQRKADGERFVLATLPVSPANKRLEVAMAGGETLNDVSIEFLSQSLPSPRPVRGLIRGVEQNARLELRNVVVREIGVRLDLLRGRRIATLSLYYESLALVAPEGAMPPVVPPIEFWPVR